MGCQRGMQLLRVVMVIIPTMVAMLADASLLRAGGGKKVASGEKVSSKAFAASMSKAESQALSALTLKYNCSKEAKSLVAQLDAVVTSNYAAEKKLNWSCAAAQSSYKRELAGKIAAATALASTANQKGADIYASGYAAANKTFLEIQSHYDTVMESANARLRESQMKAAEAKAKHNEKSQLRMAAQALFEQKCSLIDDAAATEITVLGGNRDTTIGNAKSTFKEAVAFATNDMDQSIMACLHAYRARMRLIAQDQATINEKIKPLLNRLNDCNSSSRSSNSSSSSAGGSTDTDNQANQMLNSAALIEIGIDKPDNEECKMAVHSKLLSVPTSLLQISLNTPSQDVHGNVAVWEAHLIQERVAATSVHEACKAEAHEAFTNVTRTFNDILSETIRHANASYYAELSKINDRAAQLKAAQKATFDATARPAYDAETEFNIAKAAMDEANAAAKAASELKAFTIDEARASMNDALVAAEQAKQEIINSTKADAETIRSNAISDESIKSEAKRRECEQELFSLRQERDLVDQIKYHTGALVTVKGSPLKVNKQSSEHTLNV
eukprot:g3610.t1